MDNNLFSPMEIDAIGEIMNISLGSSATAISSMLDHRVDITTPRVSVMPAEELSLGDIDPAVGVEIKYVSGLHGSNILLLKRGDIKTIVDILMGIETPEEEFELNDLTISAVCEIMNQMMGAASTALSDFLGKMVNISTPQSFELDNFDTFKAEHFPPAKEQVVIVRFILSIEGFLRSEFINVISVELARDLISGFGLNDDEASVPDSNPSNSTLSQKEIEALMAEASAVSPEPSANTVADTQQGGKLSQDEIEKLIQSTKAAPDPVESPTTQPPSSVPTPTATGAPSNTAPPPSSGYYPPHANPPYYPPQQPPREPPEPKVIPTQPITLSPLDPIPHLPEEQIQNLDLIMSVPLEISVEIGRTQRKVQDILAFSKGSLVVLDKLAGDQVDLYVNGHCIAKGDVVVIDDNFGIRITEILKPPTPNELLNV